jgi:hypothetical protein
MGQYKVLDVGKDRETIRLVDGFPKKYILDGEFDLFERISFKHLNDIADILYSKKAIVINSADGIFDFDSLQCKLVCDNLIIISNNKNINNFLSLPNKYNKLYIDGKQQGGIDFRKIQTNCEIEPHLKLIADDISNYNFNTKSATFKYDIISIKGDSTGSQDEFEIFELNYDQVPSGVIFLISQDTNNKTTIIHTDKRIQTTSIIIDSKSRLKCISQYVEQYGKTHCIQNLMFTNLLNIYTSIFNKPFKKEQGDTRKYVDIIFDEIKREYNLPDNITAIG